MCAIIWRRKNVIHTYCSIYLYVILFMFVIKSQRKMFEQLAFDWNDMSERELASELANARTRCSINILRECFHTVTFFFQNEIQFGNKGNASNQPAHQFYFGRICSSIYTISKCIRLYEWMINIVITSNVFLSPSSIRLLKEERTKTDTFILYFKIFFNWFLLENCIFFFFWV